MFIFFKFFQKLRRRLVKFIRDFFQNIDFYSLLHIFYTTEDCTINFCLLCKLLSYKKRVITTRLQKTYSVLNQAVSLSTIENGSSKYWTGSSATADDIEEWFNRYIAPYVKYDKLEKRSVSLNYDGTTRFYGLFVYFADGSVLLICNSNTNSNGIARDWHYYIQAKYVTANQVVYREDGSYTEVNPIGRYYFSFYFDTDKNRVMPYGYHYLPANTSDIRNEFMNGLYGCATELPYACAALIMYDGWEIKDDYPIKL